MASIVHWLRLGVLAVTVVHPIASAHSQLGVDDFVETRDISDLAVSPDRRLAAFRVIAPSVETNAHVLSWYVMSVAGTSQARLVADAGEPIQTWTGVGTEPTLWSNDSRWIYFRRLHKGEIQIWRAAADGSVPVEQITHDAANVETFCISKDGLGLYYSVRATRAQIQTEDEARSRSGVLYDGSVDSAHELAASIAEAGAIRSTRFGREQPRWRYLQLGQEVVREASEAEVPVSGAHRNMDEFAHERAWGQWVLSSTERAVAVLQPQEPPDLSNIYEELLPQFYRVRMESTGKGEKAVRQCRAKECAGPPGIIRILGWIKDDRSIIFANSPSSEAPRIGVYRWDLDSDRVFSVLPADGAVWTEGRRTPQIGCALTRAGMVCIQAGPNSAPRLIGVDPLSGRTRELFDPNPKLRGRTLTKVEHQSWYDSQGLRWSGWLVWPHSYQPGQRYPLVVTGYNCLGFLRGGLGDTVPEHMLAARGFFALCAHLNRPQINHIWRDGQRSTDQTQQAGYIYRRQVESWRAAVRVLHDRGLIDKKRVGLSGLSFSAQSTVYAISHYADFAAAAAPATDLLDPFVQYFNRKWGSTIHITAPRYYGVPFPSDDHAGLYQVVSPALNAHRISAPLLIQAADNEFRRTLMLYACMVHAGGPVEMFIFPGEGHMFHQPAHKSAAAERSIDWFSFWLKGTEDPAPQKHEQYARWQAMRKQEEASSKRPPSLPHSSESIESETIPVNDSN